MLFPEHTFSTHFPITASRYSLCKSHYVLAANANFTIDMYRCKKNKISNKKSYTASGKKTFVNPSHTF